MKSLYLWVSGTHWDTCMLFGAVQSVSDFGGVPHRSYGQFINYRAWIQLEKMVILYPWGSGK